MTLGLSCAAPEKQPDPSTLIPLRPITSGKRSVEDRLDEAENEIKKIWWEMRCKDDKVREFMRDCEQQLTGGGNSQCVTDNLEPTMLHMYGVPHVLVRLWSSNVKTGSKHGAAAPRTSLPADGKLLIGGLRTAQLDEIFGPEKMASTSTVWVVYQANSESRLDLDEAEKYAGLLVHDHLVGKLNVPRRTVRGPTAISCRSKSDLLKRYAKEKRDVARNDEPQAAEPQHTIWVFRVDCPNSSDTKSSTPQ